MPIFEYYCAKCQSKFEELVRSSNEIIHCSVCNGTEVEKLISAFAFSSGSESANRFTGSTSSSGCSSCASKNCAHCH